MKVKVRSIDPAAQEMLELADRLGIETAFQRSERIKACPIGQDGACCSMCAMGPCRLVGKTETGVCGANRATVAARNVARMVAAGAAAHSDHGRDLAITLREVALGKASGYRIRDERKLRMVAGLFGVSTADRQLSEIALEVAEKALAEYGRQEGELTYLARAPQKRQEIWRKHNLAPRGIDREIAETLHRTTMGTDQDAAHLLDQALRVSLASGWGGSMLATDLSDILFGTPKPVASRANLGVLAEDQVNIIVHGHEPTLSEMLVEVVSDPELLAYARSKGAAGINLAGVCCTANEILSRQGVPSAGNFLHQELAMLTGATELMVVDVQCIFQSLAELAKQGHTRFVTTSPKAMVEGAEHFPFDEEHAPELARKLVRMAIDNYPNRRETFIPHHTGELIAGYSHEYIEYMLGGRFRASFWPLNDNIINGRIFGVVGVCGCNNPRSPQDAGIIRTIEELIAHDVLVVSSGCSALACGKHGYLSPEVLDKAGPGLREVCEAIGIAPVLHLGSCVDNSRILTVMAAMVAVGGLGDDVSDLPAAGIAPEWMAEKALEIGVYFAASGAGVYFTGPNPVASSPEAARLMTEGWAKKTGGFLEFTEPEAVVGKILEHIAGKRKALGINVAKERVLYDMEARRALA